MVLSLLIAGALGLGGNSLMDVIAPLYTLLALALVLSRRMQEKSGPLSAPVDPWAPAEGSGATASSGGGGGGGGAAVGPLKDLVEPGTGITVPVHMRWSGGARVGVCALLVLGTRRSYAPKTNHSRQRGPSAHPAPRAWLVIQAPLLSLSPLSLSNDHRRG
jgi:hypothetical protein